MDYDLGLLTMRSWIHALRAEGKGIDGSDGTPRQLTVRCSSVYIKDGDPTYLFQANVEIGSKSPISRPAVAVMICDRKIGSELCGLAFRKRTRTANVGGRSALCRKRRNADGFPSRVVKKLERQHDLVHQSLALGTAQTHKIVASIDTSAPSASGWKPE